MVEAVVDTAHKKDRHNKFKRQRCHGRADTAISIQPCITLPGLERKKRTPIRNSAGRCTSLKCCSKGVVCQATASMSWTAAPCFISRLGDPAREVYIRQN